MKRFYVILNPVSGTIKVEDVLQKLGDKLNNDFQLYRTTGKEKMDYVVARALKHGYKSLVAIGGDGTISQVAECLIGKKVPLGIVATGTANNLAQELGIPLDLEKAIDLLAHGHKITKIDAMKVGDHYFFLDISIGARSLAIRDTKRKDKLRFGMMAYLWRGYQWVTGFEPRKFMVKTDDNEVEVNASEIVIANAGIFGIKPFSYSKGVRIDDGKLNVIAIEANSLMHYLIVGYRFLFNNQAAKKHLNFFTANTLVKVSAKSDLPIQGDGEIIAKRSIEVRLVPQSLRVLVPV
jgi:diacylglycerol kinase (ATP)